MISSCKACVLILSRLQFTRAKGRRRTFPAASSPGPSASGGLFGSGDGRDPGTRRADLYRVGRLVSSSTVCLSLVTAAELGVPRAAASARLWRKIKLFPGIQGGASSFLGEVSLRSVDPFFWLAGELLILSVGLGRLKEATTNLVRLLFLPLLVAVGDSAAVWIRWGFRLFGCPLLPSSSLIWMFSPRRSCWCCIWMRLGACWREEGPDR